MCDDVEAKGKGGRWLAVGLGRLHAPLGMYLPSQDGFEVQTINGDRLVADQIVRHGARSRKVRVLGMEKERNANKDVVRSALERR